MLVHPKGKEVKRHRHKLVKREIFRTQEVLLLLEGRVRVAICTDEGESLKTFILRPGDAVLLARGGHSVKVLEDAKMIEVKQGPYAGADDKEFY
jgi:mannose-6-phosphate isomerase-like protein (cupin superfamily)